MKNILDKTIGEIVADDYRTAAVFQSLGIDFCCKGNRTLEEVCESRDIESEVLIEDLQQVIEEKNTDPPTSYRSWSMDRLADHIEMTHHRYVEEHIPPLRQYLAKICQVHGKQHPELYEVAQLFGSVAGELSMHMKKEELVLFPFIRKMAKAKDEGLPISPAHFGTIKNPVHSMMEEHDSEGERFAKINKLTNGFQPPKDACNTYTLTFRLLKEFQEDLYLHIHLENNILFPGAMLLEEELI